MSGKRRLTAASVAVLIAFAMAVIMPFSSVQAVVVDKGVITITNQVLADAVVNWCNDVEDETDEITFAGYSWSLSAGDYELGENISAEGIMSLLDEDLLEDNYIDQDDFTWLVFYEGDCSLDLGEYSLDMGVHVYSYYFPESVTSLVINGSGIITGGSGDGMDELGPQAVWAEDDCSVTINGGNYTGSLTADYNSEMIINDATVIIDGYSCPVNVVNGSTLEINDGLFSGPFIAVVSYLEDYDSYSAPSVTINGGTFKAGGYGMLLEDCATLSISGGEFTGSGAGLLINCNPTISLSGGTFTASEDTFEGEETSAIIIILSEEDSENVFEGMLAKGYSYSPAISKIIDEEVAYIGVKSVSVVKDKVEKYTVSFETNGGSSVAAQTIDKGAKATKPADPSKPGYSFDDWYADSSFTEKFDFGKAINADCTVYAKWKEKEASNNENANEEDPSDDSKKDVTPETDYEEGNSDSENSSEGLKPEVYSNEWVKGVWYNSDGTQTYAFRGHWEENDIGWWYVDESGWYPTEQWQKIDGYWYYFNSIGYMCMNQYAGTWNDGEGTFWWVDGFGRWDGTAPGYWGFSDGRWFFYNTNGWFAQDSWWRIGDKWYSFDTEGWLDGSAP